MEISNLLTFILSFALLLKGGLFLVKGAEGISKLTGMGAFFAGFIVVALGTSMPEFMVCLVAAIEGSSDIAIGNMIGSNIANIGLIFGLTVLISPIVIGKEAWKEQKLALFFLIFITLAAYYLSSTGLSIGRGEGVLLFLLLTVFLFIPYGKSREEKNEVSSTPQGDSGWKLLFFVALGSMLLAGSAHFLVNSTIKIATQLGISELFIGVTAIALGTSLPELSASLVAALKKEQNIVVGNIIGSSFFNLGYLGLVAAIQPIQVKEKMLSGITSEFGFFILLTVLFAVLIGKTQIGRNRIGKKKGVILLIVYAAFLYFISGSLS